MFRSQSTRRSLGDSSRYKLVSLGSISHQPLLVFYKATKTLSLLSELKGKRLDIGPLGSGTRSLALALLKLNDIDSGTATIVDWQGRMA